MLLPFYNLIFCFSENIVRFQPPSCFHFLQASQALHESPKHTVSTWREAMMMQSFRPGSLVLGLPTLGCEIIES